MARANFRQIAYTATRIMIALRGGRLCEWKRIHVTKPAVQKWSHEGQLFSHNLVHFLFYDAAREQVSVTIDVTSGPQPFYHHGLV